MGAKRQAIIIARGAGCFFQHKQSTTIHAAPMPEEDAQEAVMVCGAKYWNRRDPIKYRAFIEQGTLEARRVCGNCRAVIMNGCHNVKDVI